jgi:hypothetical protein
VVLGYSDTELRGRGSGCRFIHPVALMYCAVSAARKVLELLPRTCSQGAEASSLVCLAVMRPGENGLAVFRLRAKPAGWLWVQCSARLLLRGGRPYRIVATDGARPEVRAPAVRQREGVNARGGGPVVSEGGVVKRLAS